jgi:hypothetical protein
MKGMYKMGLYEKMYNVMCQSTGLDKSMEVGEGKNAYKAVSEAAVLGVVKPLLKANKLVIFPVKCVVDETHTEYQGKYGLSQRFLTKLVVNYKIVDIETGEFDLLESIGYGTDTQDKGSGQAMTYAYKALLQKTFCLFSGEDTDNTHSDTKEKNSSYKPEPKKAPEPPKATKLDCNELLTVGFAKGYKAEAIEKMCIKKFGHGLEFINQEELTAMVDGFKGLPDKE